MHWIVLSRVLQMEKCHWTKHSLNTTVRNKEMKNIWHPSFTTVYINGENRKKAIILCRGPWNRKHIQQRKINYSYNVKHQTSVYWFHVFPYDEISKSLLEHALEVHEPNWYCGSLDICSLNICTPVCTLSWLLFIC